MTDYEPVPPEGERTHARISADNADPRPVGIGRSMVTLAAANLLPPIAALVTAPILAVALGVLGRGEVAAATAPYVLASAVSAFGLPESITYRVARNPAMLRSSIRRGLLLLTGSGLLTFAGVAMAASWLSGGSRDLERLIIVTGLLIAPALCTGALRGAAAGLHLWNLVARERVTSAVLRLVAVLLLLLFGHLTPVTAALSIAASPVIAALSYAPLFTMVRTRSARGQVAARGLIGFGLRAWVGSVSGILMLRLDQVLMVPLAGARELGLYAVAAAVGEVPLLATIAVREVTFSSDAATRSDERLAASARTAFLAAAVIGVPLAAAAPLGLPLMFGEGFAPATAPALILIAAAVVGAPGSVAGAGLSARGRPGLRSACLLAGGLLNFLLLIAMVPRLGATGAALATLIASAVASHLALIFLHRLYGLSPRDFYQVRRADLHRLRLELTRMNPRRTLRLYSDE